MAVMRTPDHTKRPGSKTALGQELIRLRQQAGLTQDEVADRIGVSRVAISQIERGLIRQPGDKFLLGFERLLGLSRSRALGLIAGQMAPAAEDVTSQFYRIAAISDPEARRVAWYLLPAAFRRALVAFAQDALLETAARLPGAFPAPDLRIVESDDDHSS